MDENSFILFLSLISKLGKPSIRKLILANSIKYLANQSLLNIRKCLCDFLLTSDIKLSDLEYAYSALKASLSVLKKDDIKFTSFTDASYPYRFKEIKTQENLLFEESTTSIPRDFPILLFYKGDINLLNKDDTSAVVGTRNPSLNALSLEEKLCRELVVKNKIIVSGFAKGCDMLAHKTAVKLKGRTVAILGYNLNNISSVNKELSKQILLNDGLIISEYTLRERTSKYFFIQRDRLISLSSDDVYVIQTSLSGGTMHTVKSALKYYKTLYAVSPLLLSPLNPQDISVSGNKYLLDKKKALCIESL